MSRIRFQLDEHMAHAVAYALRQRGVDARTATGSGLLNTPDAVVLEWARVEGRVVVTNDDDFLRLSDAGMAHLGIAYYAQQSRSIGELVEALYLIAEAMDSDEIAGRVEYL